ncbi:hypothetical protein WJ96_12570 [Burkholderia ubonensis]|uniref:VOC domain-containing protein n=2 Tax=Burkholderia ubonensis TaxID=101571 RepID=A0AAW3MP13_9BURK|nr:VOC family protein [Burkholderia ubonensis]KVP93997.1 hypothetical protein WJ96_12570 [Burkholderia ubonensis]KVZ48499.1 hypothetical protein WL18_08005 [Burkholderia ubonensis]KVZ97361.1 hypothetical protein WL25_09180 [Burkholderia ubonensis]
MTHLINQMGHVMLETPDLHASVHEAVNLLGLRVTMQDEEKAILTSNTRRGELTYIKSSRAAIRSFGLEAIDEAACEQALARVKGAGFEIIRDRPHAPGAAHGFVFRSPSEHAIEIHTAVPRDQPADYPTIGIRPKRLDHVTIMAANPRAMQDMLSELFGMQLSDTVDNEEFVFMRSANLYHHTIAIAKGRPGLHHVAFEALHMVDLMRVGDYLKQLGRNLAWGPGHHGANAQSYFTYHKDVIGCIIEYSYGMARIDNEAVYEPGVWPSSPAPGEDWLNLWGAPPSEMFVTGGVPVMEEEAVADLT